MDLESVIHRNKIKVKYCCWIRNMFHNVWFHHGHGDVIYAGRIMEDSANFGLSELGGCVWRLEHFPTLRLQKHFC